MVGLGFSGALRGFERRVWFVTVFYSRVGLFFFFFSPPFFLSFANAKRA